MASARRPDVESPLAPGVIGSVVSVLSGWPELAGLTRRAGRQPSQPGLHSAECHVADRRGASERLAAKRLGRGDENVEAAQPGCSEMA